jgi:hypothetical protein
VANLARGPVAAWLATAVSRGRDGLHTSQNNARPEDNAGYRTGCLSLKNLFSHLSDFDNEICLAVSVAAAEPSPRHTPVDGLLEALGALLEWPAAARHSPPPAQRTLREDDLLTLLELPNLDAHDLAGQADRPSLDAAAASASRGGCIVREMEMLALLLADSGSHEPYTQSESSGSGPAAAVCAEDTRVEGPPSPPATNSAAGQSGQAPPPGDQADADPGHVADTAAVNSDQISGAPGLAPAELESEPRRWLCRAESAVGGMGDVTNQNTTTIEKQVESNSGCSSGE